jgi:hypothetical protein
MFLNYTSSVTNTRGNSYKLYYMHAHYDLRRYFFTDRATHIWNSLDDTVVVYDTINTFKNHLNRSWQDEDVFLDWKANIVGIGNNTGNY